MSDGRGENCALLMLRRVTAHTLGTGRGGDVCLALVVTSGDGAQTPRHQQLIFNTGGWGEGGEVLVAVGPNNKALEAAGSPLCYSGLHNGGQ